jgi:hypothetical protein
VSDSYGHFMLHWLQSHFIKVLMHVEEFIAICENLPKSHKNGYHSCVFWIPSTLTIRQLLYKITKICFKDFFLLLVWNASFFMSTQLLCTMKCNASQISEINNWMKKKSCYYIDDEKFFRRNCLLISKKRYGFEWT